MKLHNTLMCITIIGLVALLDACDGGGGGSGGTQQTATLSPDQQIFEHAELHGGTFSLVIDIPYGGGNLVNGVNYAYSSSTGGLSASPLVAGPEKETQVLNSLDPVLSLPSPTPTRYLYAGQVFVRSETAQQTVSYIGSGIRIDYLADDGSTVVQSSQFFGYSETALTGMIDIAAEQLQAQYPINIWVSANNFSANARWNSGAAYIKRQDALIGDTYIAVDCTNSLPYKTTTTASTKPCQTQATLDNFFPVTLNDTKYHPYETDFSADGTINHINGVRMWVANVPLPDEQSIVPSYRVYYELNGNVYMGMLEKDGTHSKYHQNDGSVVDYYIGLNQAAVNSVQQGLITGAVTPGGSQMGSAAEVGFVDLFGLGAHGVNGGLAPVDLRTHYNIPSGLNGAGQTIAIVDPPLSGNVVDDLNVYSQYFNLPNLPLCNSANPPCFQHIDLSSGKPGSNSEAELDTQMVHAIAPGATIILVTAKSENQSDMFAAINYAAALPGVTAVSMSFSYFPTTSDAQIEDALLSGFQTNQGVIFFASSGDKSFAAGGAGYPASSPYVTAVGGTRINSISWNEAAQSEVAWEFSGGGISNYAPMPNWQLSYLGSSAATVDDGMRAVPDVAAVADPQHSAVSIYYKQHWVMSGGTSASTPIWAGVSALFGQYLVNKGSSLPALVKATPGGFSGLLYQAKLTKGENSGFYDIVSGTNNLGSSPCNLCSAGPGYDNITGLGAPDSSELFANF